MPECDITKTGVVLELLETQRASRDASWRQQFYDAVVTASFKCADPQVFQGPDGFPYFGLLSPEPFVPFESFCISNLLETLTGRGLGAAINPRPEGSPDWVFSYGDLLTLRHFKAFEPPGVRVQPPPAVETIQRKETVLVAQPSESFLPGYSRRAINDFLTTRVGIKNPGVFLMNRSSGEQQLVFSVFPEDFRSEDDFRQLLGRISWYLPRHYSVVAVERSSDLARSFQPLWQTGGGSGSKDGKPWYKRWK